MKTRPLNQHDIPAVIDLMKLGTPFVRPRTESDYWLYANLFSSTCPVAVDGDDLVGAVIAFRSQDHPEDIYIQDVVTHPEHRRRGITTALLNAVRDEALRFNCTRLYLTSEPENTPAHHTWTRLGFTNVAGDQTVNGVSVISDYKGVGKHRAVYELQLT
ncbi:GNAT family N-acetyltransferase [Saccharopolyspora endophytica]|uniref:GNAT family N-acetyltransferase n=1 Tax=Saccharopolyspora endophytica TaxID=543886 RepID=A0ABS5DK12_9PSEU|nr:GNAT family N-acetyltransferase [Saccharopolyspora endophytica]MBQ0926630.1 GNAT family N-acetyltransferase [Saccharopolyspora endophytica]